MESKDILDRGTYYDHICIFCNRYGDDHSPMCYNWIPPWERNEKPIELKGELLDRLQQVESELKGWRQKHAQALLEIDKLKTKVNRGNKKYTYTE